MQKASQLINFNLDNISDLRKLELLLKIKLQDIMFYIDEFDAENNMLNLTSEQKNKINSSLNKMIIEMIAISEHNEQLEYNHETDSYNYDEYNISKHLNLKI